MPRGKRCFKITVAGFGALTLASIESAMMPVVATLDLETVGYALLILVSWIEVPVFGFDLETSGTNPPFDAPVSFSFVFITSYPGTTSWER